jgi:hypothetical protein
MTVWAFKPQPRITETLEWLTDVIRTFDGEQRICTRPCPRREVSHSFHLGGSNYAVAAELAKSLGGNEFYLPRWTQPTEVGNIAPSTATLPVNPDYQSYVVNGKAIIWESATHYEVLTVSVLGSGTITVSPAVAGNYVRALVMPLLTVTFAQSFEGARGNTDRVVEASGRFCCVDLEDLSNVVGDTYQSYRNYPLVSEPTVILGGASEQFGHDLETLDTRTGLLWNGPRYDDPIRSSVLAWSDLGLPHYPLLKWLHKCHGRQKAFWASSWFTDLEITAPISIGDGTIEIAAIDYGSFFPSTADFAVVDVNRNVYPIRVVGVADGDPGKEVLTLDVVTTFALALADLQGTSRIVLSRFNSDRIEVNYDVGQLATVTVPIVEVVE